MIFRLILVGMVLVHNQSGVALVPRVSGHLPAALLLEGTCEPAADCIDAGPPPGIVEMALHLNRDDISFGFPTQPGAVSALPSLCQLAARSAGTDPAECTQGNGPQLHADCLTGNPTSCPVVARVRLPAVPTACHVSHEPLYTTPPAILTACSDLWGKSKLPVRADVFEYGFQKASATTIPTAEVTALPNAVVLEMNLAEDSVTLERVPINGGRGEELTLRPIVASDGQKVVAVVVLNEPVSASGGRAPMKHTHFKHFYTTLQSPATDPFIPVRTGVTTTAEVGKCEPYLVCLDAIFEDRATILGALDVGLEDAGSAKLLLPSPPHNAQECDVPTYP